MASLDNKAAGSVTNKISLAPFCFSRQKGFSLIELITVTIILAIVASMGTSFIASSIEGYNQTQFRAKLINKSRQAMERMTRQLRLALPHSVLVSNFVAGLELDECITFLPVVGGGHYIDLVPQQAGGGVTTSNQVNVGPFRVDFGTARMMTIGAMGNNEIFNVNPYSMAPRNSIAILNASIASAPGFNTVTPLVLSGNKQWRRNSPQKRFYLIDNPAAFCIVGSELRYYDSFDDTPPWDQNVTPRVSASVLLAEGVTGGGNSFQISSGTESRNSVVTINLSFSENSETVTFQQELHLRNTP